MNSIFTSDQEQQIRAFLKVINDTGGFGSIRLEIKNGEVKFITLEEVSAKFAEVKNESNKNYRIG